MKELGGEGEEGKESKLQQHSAEKFLLLPLDIQCKGSVCPQSTNQMFQTSLFSEPE